MSSNSEEEKTTNDLVMTEIEKRNPYLSYNREQDVMVATSLPDIENNRLSETILVQTSDNRTLVLTRDILERAIQLQRYSCTIKFLCIIDFVMNFLYLYIGYQFALLFMVCSIGGYISTYTYRRKWLLLYLIYQYFQVLARAAIFTTLILLAADPSLRSEFQKVLPEHELPKNYVNSILVSFLFLIVQSYITCFVQSFYKLLPNKIERQQFLTNS